MITGANKGIGHEVARQLAAKGFHVLVGARNAKAGRKAAEEIAKKCGKATFLEIDVADNDSVTSAAREFSNIEDHLDVLVNNAGIIVDGDMQFWKSATICFERHSRQIRSARCA